MNTIPEEYKKIQDMVFGYVSTTNLNPFRVYFELIPSEDMNSIASYIGFPNRYPHWRFGMEYERNSKMNSYGLQHIYELVINNDPSYAYLVEGSDIATLKTVMAHVYAHSDFFRNNYAFKQTNRKMLDKMGDHATIIRKIIDIQGIEKVESFIDSCLMIEDLIDSNYPFMLKKSDREPIFEKIEKAQEIPRLKAKEYMQPFINPPEFLEAQKKKMDEAKKKEKEKVPEPNKNIMVFLLENAPLEPWEAKILSIMIEEAYYFLPQKQTKIMNEGWATYWHSKLMTEYLLRPENVSSLDELLSYADQHSKIIQPYKNSINPYRLGLELFKDIEYRWNTGRHGKAFEECESMEKKSRWNTKEGKGLEKIFLVRSCYNDLTFIDEFFTPEFAEENKYFVHASDEEGGRTIISREFKEIKDVLLNSLTNMGLPLIYVIDSNFKNRNELQLYHKWTGIELRSDFAETTLKSIAKIWKRPVCIETIKFETEKKIRKEKNIRIRTDGEKIDYESGTSKVFV